ncbi:MAG: sugar transferase [Ignavibacteriaceae bacterium]
MFTLTSPKSKVPFRLVKPEPVTQLDAVVNKEVLKLIKSYVDTDSPRLKIIDTSTKLNVDLIEERKLDCFINLRKVNDIRFLNKFFESVNARLKKDGIFIGCVETDEERAARILRKFNKFIAYPYYALDFIVKRILPKFRLTTKLYFFLTQGRNRVLSKAEVLGRLVSCGFDIFDVREINNLLYFVVYKIREPYFPKNPSYGPIFKMRRIGKNGKTIYVYKLRTMHPYAEYLQEYVYNINGTSTGDKFNNDFRITKWAAIFRKLWIDEFPMIINLLKGDVKLIGVRPLSFHKFSIYPKYLQEKRIKFKPGLVPPYYADLPKSVEEMVLSELKYLDSYEKNPISTDWKYFWMAFYNIVFKKARSG